MSYQNEENEQDKETKKAIIAEYKTGDLPSLAGPADAVIEDPAQLKVRGRNGENKPYIKSLAHAIVTVLGKHGYASLKCVGASSVNNAIKSFTIAAGEAKTHGLNLVLSSGFQNAMFDDVEKTAMVFKIFDR